MTVPATPARTVMSVVHPSTELAASVPYHYDRHMQGPGGAKVAKFKLTRKVARDRVRALSAESTRTAKLIWTGHIQKRTKQRGIDSDAVLKILRQGDIDEEPCEGEKPGDWKVKLTFKMPTGRIAGVVAVITRDDRLALVTAEWEDHQ